MRRPIGFSATALLALLSAGAQAQTAPEQGSCAASIRAVLADIAARDLDTADGPPRNAFIALNPSAVAAAEQLDRDAAAGRAKGPLFCLPVAVKDNFDTVDMPATVGSLSLIGNQAPRDAVVVARLRQAGAVIVGKTNMDEFAMGIRGLSSSGGRVGNAYDPWQSPGGSSAGSGVAVGTGFVPLAVGSDNCGSLRIPAVYNGAVSLRATYGRFDTDGVFPIGFVNGVPGLIASDTAILRAGLAAISDGWRAGRADETSALRGKRFGVVRKLGKRDLWAAADAPTRQRFDEALSLIRREAAAVVDVDLDRFDARLGPEFLRGFGPRVDAAFARYAAPRRDWRDICTSGRGRPEWPVRECLRHGSSSAKVERRATDQIERNRTFVTGLMDRLNLDALVYAVDARGGARADVSDGLACMIAGSSGLPAVAFPTGLDERGMPLGLELLGRAQSDETLVAMMASYETARGPLPRPKRSAGRPDLATLGIPAQNNLRLTLGFRARQSRHGQDIGALEPQAFRALTEDVVRSWPR